MIETTSDQHLKNISISTYNLLYFKYSTKVEHQLLCVTVQQIVAMVFKTIH